VPDHIAAAVIFLPACKILEIGVLSFASPFGKRIEGKKFAAKAKVNKLGHF
jgi:hypothetical protein